MKRMLLLAVVAALGLSLPGAAGAMRLDDDVSAVEIEVKGTVVSVSPAEIVVQPDGGSAPVSLDVPAGFDISGIEPGDHVEVEGEDGVLAELEVEDEDEAAEEENGVDNSGPGNAEQDDQCDSSGPGSAEEQGEDCDDDSGSGSDEDDHEDDEDDDGDDSGGDDD